jgi:hypothetical protein
LRDSWRISICELAQLQIETTDGKSALRADGARMRPDKSGVERLCSDNRCAWEPLGRAPRVRLEEASQGRCAGSMRSARRFRIGVFQT